MKKVVVFGSNGLLGQNLVTRFNSDYDVTGCSLEASSYVTADIPYLKVDMINRSEITEFLLSSKPDIIINAAAYTDVDGSEKNRELCWNTNVRAVENIIDAAESFKPLLVQISSDYVFDGSMGDYREMDTTNPNGNYSRSKMAAENIVTASNLEYIIARTQVLYGTGNNVRLNFATWVVSRLKNKQDIKVVSDQVGNPTYIDDLSESIFRLIDKKEYGLFHIAGSEKISRYDFARKIAEVFSLDESFIEKITTEQLQQAAPRPMNSTFIIDKLVNRIDWEPGDIESGLKRLKEKMDEKDS